MRWGTWPVLENTVKHKSWFALLPVTVLGETRWLERVTVAFRCKRVADFLPPCLPRLKYVAESFVEPEEPAK